MKNKTTKIENFCWFRNLKKISKKSQLTNIKVGLIVILLAMGIVAIGLSTEEKPVMIPEEGEMFSPDGDQSTAEWTALQNKYRIHDYHINQLKGGGMSAAQVQSYFNGWDGISTSGMKDKADYALNVHSVLNQNLARSAFTDLGNGHYTHDRYGGDFYRQADGSIFYTGGDDTQEDVWITAQTLPPGELAPSSLEDDSSWDSALNEPYCVRALGLVRDYESDGIYDYKHPTPEDSGITGTFTFQITGNLDYDGDERRNPQTLLSGGDPTPAAPGEPSQWVSDTTGPIESQPTIPDTDDGIVASPLPQPEQTADEGDVEAGAQQTTAPITWTRGVGSNSVFEFSGNPNELQEGEYVRKKLANGNYNYLQYDGVNWVPSGAPQTTAPPAAETGDAEPTGGVIQWMITFRERLAALDTPAPPESTTSDDIPYDFEWEFPDTIDEVEGVWRFNEAGTLSFYPDDVPQSDIDFLPGRPIDDFGGMSGTWYIVTDTSDEKHGSIAFYPDAVDAVGDDAPDTPPVFYVNYENGARIRVSDPSVEDIGQATEFAKQNYQIGSTIESVDEVTSEAAKTDEDNLYMVTTGSGTTMPILVTDTDGNGVIDPAEIQAQVYDIPFVDEHGNAVDVVNVRKSGPPGGIATIDTFRDENGDLLELTWDDETGEYTGSNSEGDEYFALSADAGFSKLLSDGIGTGDVPVTVNYDQNGQPYLAIIGTDKGYTTVDIDTYNEITTAAQDNLLQVNANGEITIFKDEKLTMRVFGDYMSTTVESQFTNTGTEDAPVYKPSSIVTRTPNTQRTQQMNYDTNGDGRINNLDNPYGIHVSDVEHDYAADTVTYTDYDQSGVTRNQNEVMQESTTYNPLTLEPEQITVYVDDVAYTATIQRDEEGNVMLNENGNLVLTGHQTAKDRLSSLQSQYGAREFLAGFEYTFTQFQGLSGFSRLMMGKEQYNRYREKVDKIFSQNLLGEEYWVAHLCTKHIRNIPENFFPVETPNGLMAMASYAGAERSEPIIYPDGSGEYLYKIWFVINNPTNSGWEDLMVNVQLRGERAVNIFTQNLLVDEGRVERRTGENAIAQYSKYKYDEVCIWFDRHMTSIDGEDMREQCFTITEPSRSRAITPQETTTPAPSGGYDEPDVDLGDNINNF